jgi:hypothetical protein
MTKYPMTKLRLVVPVLVVMTAADFKAYENESGDKSPHSKDCAPASYLNVEC